MASRAYVAADSDLLTSGPPPTRSAEDRAAQCDEFGNLYPRTVFLKHVALSTSGDTEQFVEINGRRYSHIVDPRMELSNQRMQTTVVAADSVTADSHATALCVLASKLVYNLPTDENPNPRSGAGRGSFASDAYKGVESVENLKGQEGARPCPTN